MTEKTETPIALGSSDDRKFPAGALDDFMNRMSASVGDGPNAAPSMSLRSASVVIEPELCRPGTFKTAVKIGIRELDADTELKTMRDIEGSNDKAMAIELGRAAMYSVNGRALAGHEKKIVWEALGMGGRVCVGTAFMEHCAGLDPDMLGKSLASVELE